jgi:ankyrin repeat protein
MYPNPQDVVPLPERPNLEQYKKQAKDLVKACRSGAPDAIREWAARWPEHSEQIEQFARETLTSRGCALTAGQFVIARMHGFLSWPKFSAHLDGLARTVSPISQFERAAEAIVAGDEATLRRLLREHPELIRARSTREHRSTLLHYNAANGVENYRQKTPANAVRIAEILLDAGAEVDAEADMYGGGCTALGLAATSVFPELAGVQNALMQTLIDHGATIDRTRGVGTHTLLHRRMLANGRPAAAEYLAAHGARLDLDGAAGLGRLDVVAGFFNADGTLKSPATPEQLRRGFEWACLYGRTAVVTFLLEHGVPADAPLRDGGQTGLHLAALGGHTDIVALLLERGIPVGTVETTYNGTPLTWALHGWSEATGPARDRFPEVVARLVAAGAMVNPAWLDAGAPRTPFGDRVHADARMLAALRGERN